MIKPLRKRHFQIWLMLAFLIPIGILLGLLALPKQVQDKLLQPPAGNAFEQVIKTVSHPSFSASLRTNADHTRLQLEWTNKDPLDVPSALIYQTKDTATLSSTQNENLVGRVEPRGKYLFPIKNTSSIDTLEFIVYDIIHHRVVDRIHF